MKLAHAGAVSDKNQNRADDAQSTSEHFDRRDILFPAAQFLRAKAHDRARKQQAQTGQHLLVEVHSLTSLRRSKKQALSSPKDARALAWYHLHLRPANRTPPCAVSGAPEPAQGTFVRSPVSSKATFRGASFPGDLPACGQPSLSAIARVLLFFTGIHICLHYNVKCPNCQLFSPVMPPAQSWKARSYPQSPAQPPAPPTAAACARLPARNPAGTAASRASLRHTAEASSARRSPRPSG